MYELVPDAERAARRRELILEFQPVPVMAARGGAPFVWDRSLLCVAGR